jgi:hypothetical protein
VPYYFTKGPDTVNRLQSHALYATRRRSYPQTTPRLAVSDGRMGTMPSHTTVARGLRQTHITPQHTPHNKLAMTLNASYSCHPVPHGCGPLTPPLQANLSSWTEPDQHTTTLLLPLVNEPTSRTTALWSGCAQSSFEAAGKKHTTALTRVSTVVCLQNCCQHSNDPQSFVASFASAPVMPGPVQLETSHGWTQQPAMQSDHWPMANPEQLVWIMPVVTVHSWLSCPTVAALS